MSEEKFDKNQMLFLGLIQSLSANVWIQLGKQKNPVTDKLEKNLPEASFSIDLLEMIKAKTAGNLNSDEERILERTVSDLKMNYIDEKMKEDREKAETEKTKETDKKEKAESKPEPEAKTEKSKKKKNKK